MGGKPDRNPIHDVSDQRSVLEHDLLLHRRRDLVVLLLRVAQHRLHGVLVPFHRDRFAPPCRAPAGWLHQRCTERARHVPTRGAAPRSRRTTRQHARRHAVGARKPASAGGFSIRDGVGARNFRRSGVCSRRAAGRVPSVRIPAIERQRSHAIELRRARGPRDHPREPATRVPSS